MGILDIIGHSDLEDADLIKLIFLDYERRKKAHKLYSKDDYIPQNLIKVYFKSPDHLDFSKIVSNFKRKYINNENELENVHNKEEREGLSAVYDYLRWNTPLCFKSSSTNVVLPWSTWAMIAIFRMSSRFVFICSYPSFATVHCVTGSFLFSY